MNFKYDLGAQLTISCSGENGIATSRMESINSQPQYHLRYQAAVGNAVEQWWAEDALHQPDAS